MKVCMVGLGSIGIQHTRNLAHILKGEGAEFQIDALRMRGGKLPEDVGAIISETYSSFEALPRDYNIIFINTPTNMHFEHLKEAIGRARHIFIEKPVFDRVDHPLQDLNLRRGGVYYVACPLRYHSVIDYLKEFVRSRQVFSVRSICSSYLPEWRPGIDYRTCYSARAEQGGGVRIDLIHEWDYLCYLFGAPNKIEQLYGTFSNLEITSEDLAVYIAEYQDKLVSLHLDYFGRTMRREVELYTADDIVIGDLNDRTVRFLKERRTISLPQNREEMQRAELSAFLLMTRGEAENHNTIADAAGTLRIAVGEI